jgi:murein DD-endopeptidase MepM/ murein hydrolase activator NlpD
MRSLSGDRQMQNLRALRRSRSLTFLDLAALTGIPARQIAEVEYGLRRLSSAERDSLALVLGLSPAGFTGAHRRPQAAALARPAPGVDQRALQTLVAAALAATLATGAVLGGADVRPPTFSLPSSALLTGAPAPAELAAPSGAAIRYPALAAAPDADEAAAIVRLVGAIVELRAALPEVPLSPALLVAPTPPDSVAPPPVPVVAPAFLLTDAGPLGCPVRPAAGAVVMTQGYGVGTHAPAATWGAIDLAVDGDGDGYADPGASWYAPVVATHDGRVTVNLDSWPAGNHVWVGEPAGLWRTGYGHLALVTVADGQYVRAGEQIGMVGSTGVSSGPHLHYHVWRGDQNVDPTQLVGCR